MSQDAKGHRFPVVPDPTDPSKVLWKQRWSRSGRERLGAYGDNVEAAVSETYIYGKGRRYAATISVTILVLDKDFATPEEAMAACEEHLRPDPDMEEITG